MVQRWNKISTERKKDGEVVGGKDLKEVRRMTKKADVREEDKKG